MSPRDDIRELEAALGEIDAQSFAAEPGARAIGAPAAGIDDLCRTLKKIRPALERLLPVIEALQPTVGKALRLLLTLADSVCKERG